MDRTILADDLEALPWFEHMIAVLALCAIVVLSALLAVFGRMKPKEMLL